jgi:hypothetical protein
VISIFTLWRQEFGSIFYISRKFVDPHVVVFTLFGLRNTEVDKLEREGALTFERCPRIIHLGDSTLQDIKNYKK